MKPNKIFALPALLLASVAAAQAQTPITVWDFDGAGTVAAPDNSPAPSLGSGTATVLGMNNSYNSASSLPYADVLATAGASTGAGSYAWRIRGGSVAGGAGTPNGYSSSAPIGTQGAEFQSSTAGFDDIQVSFDLYMTTQAPAKMELLYTLDGSTWLNASTLSYASNPGYILNNSTSANTVNGTYFFQTGGQGWYNDITANLGAIPGAGNDANFGIEIVNAATGADDVSYLGAAYNNTSGNWRLDNVDISGTVEATPEPSTLALAGCGMAALIGYRRLDKRRA